MLQSRAADGIPQRINFNMRCFEMIDREHPGWAARVINFNMRCFEICTCKYQVPVREDKL